MCCIAEIPKFVQHRKTERPSICTNALSCLQRMVSVMPQQNSFDELSNTAPRWQVCIRCEKVVRGAASCKLDVQRDQAKGFVLVEVCMLVLSALAVDVRVTEHHLLPRTGLVFGGKACPGLCPVTLGSPRVVRWGRFCVVATPRHAVNKLLT
mmetsp:Transcript_2130/g.6080  ORF Transcript_2130/g.6080 Transcript_2130/m.6080 type:complete len:152 (-) Transcript_2130:247-702(-)